MRTGASGQVSTADADLVAAALDGEASAFEELYRAHAAAVARVVACEVRDAEAAADALQETFLRALARLSSLRDPSRFRPWLLAIARNAAIDERRHRGRSARLTEEMLVELVAVGPSASDIVELRELARLLDGCVALLPPRDAVALSLVAQSGFAPREVGETLGVSANAARVMLHRARRRLHDELRASRSAGEAL
ncbi:MAG: RNA polymerase sigma factor [Acidimicrobiales bacterium]